MHLGVEYDTPRLFAIRRLVKVDRTEAVCMLHDGDACGVLDGLHERIASAKPHAIKSILMSLIVAWLPIELSLNLK